MAVVSNKGSLVYGVVAHARSYYQSAGGATALLSSHGVYYPPKQRGQSGLCVHSSIDTNGVHDCKRRDTLQSTLELKPCIKGERYNITNEALIGACFLPSGLGNISMTYPMLDPIKY